MSVLLTEALKWVGKLHDGPDVPRMAREIAQVFPDLSGYCANATNSTSWCGIFQAWLLSKFKIRPPHGDDGVGGFMYVDAWAKVPWGGTRIEPGNEQPGDIICLSSPHHITMLKAVEGDRYRVVGGNQSDGVTETTFARSGLMAILRPPEAVAIGVNPATGTALRPLVKRGDVNDAVRELQTMLGLALIDGEFGDDTDGAVRAFQAAHGLLVDGEVGDDTWAALMSAPGAKPTPVSDVPHAAEYADYWRRMTILPEHASELDSIARKLIGNKSRYQTAQAQTGVPWFVIAVLHQRESSASFSRQLAQGDPINQVSTNVPAGRGPFPSWEASAVDALVTLKHLDQIKSWPIERIAYECERYNGFGYRNHSVPSAYLWSFSNIYRGGKYIKDGPDGWSPTTFDQQCGTMPMLKQMMALDASISFAAVPVRPDPILIPPDPTGKPMPDPEVLPPEQSIDGLIAELNKVQRPVLQKWLSSQGGEPAMTPTRRRVEMIRSLGGTPSPALLAELEKETGSTTYTPIPTTAPPTTAPVVQKPSVQLSAIALGIVSALQAGGVIGTPFGMGTVPTDAGTLSTLAPIITGLVGMTGAWGKVASVGLQLLGPLLTGLAGKVKQP